MLCRELGVGAEQEEMGRVLGLWRRAGEEHRGAMLGPAGSPLVSISLFWLWLEVVLLKNNMVKANAHPT